MCDRKVFHLTLVTQSILLGLLSALFVGLSVFALAVSSRKTSVAHVIFWAKLGGISIASIYAVMSGSLSSVTTDQWVQMLLISLIGVCGYFAYVKALRLGPVAIVSPIVACEGLVVILLAVFLAGEYLEIMQWGAVVVTVVGVILATLNTRGLSGGKFLISEGPALACFTMVMFGLAVYLLARLSQDVGWFVPLYVSNTVYFLSSTPVVLAKGVPWKGLSLKFIAFIALAGILEIGGFSIFFKGTEIGIISLVSASFITHPLVPIAGGMLVFRERLTLSQAVGVVSVLAGILILFLI